MRPDIYGPDAVIAERLYDETPPAGQCAVCACDIWTHADTHLCDDCCRIVCPKCDGTQIAYERTDRYGRDTVCVCGECDGDGFVSFAQAKRGGFKVTR